MSALIMEGIYNYYIVALSCLIAVLASYSALSISARISRASGGVRFFWTLAGSFVMGTGIWATHFVGMQAVHLGMEVRYDWWLTTFSMGVSMISSWVAFYITLPKKVGRKTLILGSGVMGGGIVLMHYIGMEAMIMPARLSYDPVYVILSAGIAVGASYMALILFLRFRNKPGGSGLKWASALAMGVAVCGMHYTGMKAARFLGDPGMRMTNEHVVDLVLLYGVTVVILIILSVSWTAIFLDRFVLESMAYRDTITGLPNRNEMNRFLHTVSDRDSLGVLFLDLDQFKSINDTLGHSVGDLLIGHVGRRLLRFAGEGREVFRIGGDEFLFIVSPCGEDRARRLAEQILQCVKQVYFIQGNELYITASIGICLRSSPMADGSTLLKSADTAMYRAKSAGKNRYCFYSKEMELQEIRRMELEKDLKKALDNREFYLVYQPKWSVKENRLVGWEALIRWNHPRLGMVSPGEFIPIAEETGLIVPMTRWSLKQACRQCGAWLSRGVRQPVSVNLSVGMFWTGSLHSIISGVLYETGLDPRLLELEITESMVLHDVQEIIRQIERLRDMGVRISMDDFGSGYSSIGLLDRIPLDTLKLDRLFTNDLEMPAKRAIISAIIQMASNLHLDVIAEGVETGEQVSFLTELGCHVMQGYYYGKPMRVEQIDEWLLRKGGLPSS
ncbi:MULTISPECIES: putative bifunctional diguanylate cyclase/phosphodiesterase [Paenibacillus]|uniref:putative bifunctional diguanylate cyclase/phosphodiesterase n=1 Tax=Paenibacillus TaxID=44249 RepID=UPI002FE0DEF0